MELQQRVIGDGEHPFDSWNALQPHLISKLGRGFGEVFAATTFKSKLSELSGPTKIAMQNLHELYLTTRVFKDEGAFREGDFMTSDQIRSLKKRSLELCMELKSDSLKIADAYGSREE